MNFGCYHTHSFYCDGNMWPEDYVKKAVELGFKAIGFSGHAPTNIETTWQMKKEDLLKYIDDVNSLKEKYKDEIEVYLGLEIDYVRNVVSPLDQVYKNSNLDYFIGSVHFLECGEGKYLCVDGTASEFDELLEKGFNNDIKALVKNYYERVREMVITSKPDIVGHLDLVKKLNKENKYFNENEKWYQDEVIKTLDVIKATGCIVEVNTGGRSRGYMKEFYPSNWILKEALQRNIKVILNGDAHQPDNINAFYVEAICSLKDVGYKSQSVLYRGKWQEVNI